MSQRIAGGGYNGRKGERKNRIKTLMSFLMTLGICLLLLNACSEGSGSSAAPTEPVFLKISTDLTSSKVDVNPAHDVVAENIVLHGHGKRSRVPCGVCSRGWECQCSQSFCRPNRPVVSDIRRRFEDCGIDTPEERSITTRRLLFPIQARRLRYAWIRYWNFSEKMIWGML